MPERRETSLKLIVGRKKKQLQAYIKKQLEEDELSDQMSLKEYTDPFTGSKNTKA